MRVIAARGSAIYSLSSPRKPNGIEDFESNLPSLTARNDPTRITEGSRCVAGTSCRRPPDLLTHGIDPGWGRTEYRENTHRLRKSVRPLPGSQRVYCLSPVVCAASRPRHTGYFLRSLPDRMLRMPKNWRCGPARTLSPLALNLKNCKPPQKVSLAVTIRVTRDCAFYRITYPVPCIPGSFSGVRPIEI